MTEKEPDTEKEEVDKLIDTTVLDIIALIGFFIGLFLFFEVEAEEVIVVDWKGKIGLFFIAFWTPIFILGGRRRYR